MNRPIHLSDARHFKRLWLDLGGSIHDVRRTGEVRYLHPHFAHSVRANDRRKDVPAVLLSRVNQLRRRGGDEGNGNGAAVPGHARA